jgi:uncharacterized cupredoxin-like copper-binding protein
MSRIAGPLILTTIALLGLGAAAHATNGSPAVVHVDLMDPSTNASIKEMTIKADATGVRAGRVIFQVSNNSKSLVHEMIVVSVANPLAPLPYDRAGDRLDEAKINDLGEAPDLKPGEKKTLQLTLKPGKYILICNQPDHFKSGMKTNLVVTQ